MCEAERMCAENIGLKDIARSRRGGTNFSGGTNNILQITNHHLTNVFKLFRVVYRLRRTIYNGFIVVN